MIVTEPRGHKREVTFQGYSTSQTNVWNVGRILSDETFHFNGTGYQSLIASQSVYGPKQVSAAADPEAHSYDSVKIPILLQTDTVYPQTGQQSSMLFGTVANYDRYGNPDFREERNFDGSLLRKTVYTYAHRDGDGDDSSLEGNNFIHSVSNMTITDQSGQKVSQTRYTVLQRFQL